MKHKYALPLAAFLGLGTAPSIDAAKDAFNYFRGSSKGIERVVQNSSGNELEKLLGGVAYGQSDGIDKKAQMDYNEIARKAGRILKPDSYKDVLDILQPYEEDPKNQSDLFFNNLGVAYSLAREPKKAESALIKAIQFNPNEEAQRFNLAYLYLTQFSEPQYKKIAEEHLIYILKNINPSSTPARVYLNRIKTGKI
ncbi:hypothetical protein HYT53_00655 [Candidatus Woesearchaeota archaeon]|nr:hypothetical protein [Candidatus Woesearchaeota archaeon]